MCNTTHDTEGQFREAMRKCRELFRKKLHDYGASWRILRPSSLTDQLFIKAKRIRSLEIKKQSMVGEGMLPEFVALINYGIVGLIQLDKGFADTADVSADEAMALYDRHAEEALQLMLRKNHDYDEAWRSMRVSSYNETAEDKGDGGHRGQHPRERGHRLKLHGHNQLCRVRGDKTEQ